MSIDFKIESDTVEIAISEIMAENDLSLKTHQDGDAIRINKKNVLKYIEQELKNCGLNNAFYSGNVESRHTKKAIRLFPELY